MQTNNVSSEKNGQNVNLLDLMIYLASKWKWYLLSLIVCVGVAWLKYAKASFVT